MRPREGHTGTRTHRHTGTHIHTHHPVLITAPPYYCRFLGYGAFGSTVASPVTLSLPEGNVHIFTNACLLLHVGAAYCINSTVFGTQGMEGGRVGLGVERERERESVCVCVCVCVGCRRETERRKRLGIAQVIFSGYLTVHFI